MAFDRRLIEYFDWGLLGIVLILGCMGLIALYSAVSAGIGSHQTVFITKQLIWYGIGMAAMIIFFTFSYKTLEKYADFIYAIGICLLVSVLIFGKFVGGSQRWLILGPISIQPSEVAKLTVVIMLARHYSKFASEKGLTWRGLINPCLITAIPFLLIVKQPDL